MDVNCASTEVAVKPDRSRKRPKDAATFVVEFGVRFSPKQAKKAAARFNVGTALYNASLRECFDRAEAMRTSPEWAKAATLPRKVSGTSNPERRALFDAARTAAGFTKREMASFGSALRVGWLRDGVAAQEAQVLAEQAFGACDAWVYGRRGRPRYKPMRRGIHSIEGAAYLPVHGEGWSTPPREGRDRRAGIVSDVGAVRRVSGVGYRVGLCSGRVGFGNKYQMDMEFVHDVSACTKVLVVNHTPILH